MLDFPSFFFTIVWHDISCFYRFYSFFRFLNFKILDTSIHFKKKVYILRFFKSQRGQPFPKTFSVKKGLFCIDIFLFFFFFLFLFNLINRKKKEEEERIILWKNLRYKKEAVDTKFSPLDTHFGSLDTKNRVQNTQFSTPSFFFENSRVPKSKKIGK